MSLRLKKEPWVPDTGEKLTRQEQEAANAELIVKHEPFRRLERHFLDPLLPNQTIAVVSFIALKEPVVSQSNEEKGSEKKLYGFMKVRGVFNTDFEATEFSKKMIKTFDSSNVYHHVRVGHPFAIATDVYGEREYVSIDKHLEEAEKMLKLKENERETEEKLYFEKRVKELEDDVTSESISDTDRYIILREKYATMGYYYEEYIEKIKQFESIGRKAYCELIQLQKEKPNVLLEYEEKYSATRRKSGLDKDKSEQNIRVQQYFNALPIFSFIKQERENETK
jgi:hypothetical protein